MDVTAVPKATIDENGDLRPGERNIRMPRDTPVIHPEPQAPAMQLPAQLDLRLGVAPFDATQVARNLVAQGRGPRSLHFDSPDLRSPRPP